MTKIFIYSIWIGFLLISCKENNTSFNAKQMEETKTAEIGIVSNIIGSNIYNEEALSSKKIGTLKYAEKISVINFDENQNLIKIKFKEKDAYILKSDIEIISSELYKKSYFTKDCYCLLGSDEIKTINFPTQYDTIHYFFKDNKIRLIKINTYCRPLYDSYKENEYDVKKSIAELGYLEEYYTINKNNFFDGDLFFEKNKTYLSCYNKKSVFDVTDAEVKLSKFYSVEEFNYAMNLFNIDLLYANIDFSDFVKPMPNFDYTKTEMLIEQDKMNVNKNSLIQLYTIDKFESVKYSQNYISFNYLREIKKNNGTYFAKINVLESLESNITGEYYIDLKAIKNFADIPD